MRIIIFALLPAASCAAADADIYRCPLDDGTFAFQQMPCPEAEGTGDELQPEPEPELAPESSVGAPLEPEDPRPSEPPLPAQLSVDRATCEKDTRDAIDAIDLEMRQTSYSKEQGEQYLADLLELTRQLRACKQL